jgi:hypothetical protein
MQKDGETMEYNKEFYAVLIVAVVAVISVIYLVATLMPGYGSGTGITGAVVGEPTQTEQATYHGQSNIDWARVIFGTAIVVVCVGLVYNMYRQNE